MEELTPDEAERWARLEEAMLVSLDDHETDSLERSRKAARNKLERSGLKEPPIDRAAVQRFLLAYSSLDKTQGRCIRECGISKDMILSAYDLWPESRFVRDYLAHRRHRSVEMDNEDLVESARDGLRRVMTVDGVKLNANAIMFALERLDPESFGARRKVAEGKAQVVYIIPGLTLNMVVAPSELPNAKPAGQVIDVEDAKCLNA
mgnify:CR=1 FL=1